MTHVAIALSARLILERTQGAGKEPKGFVQETKLSYRKILKKSVGVFRNPNKTDFSSGAM